MSAKYGGSWIYVLPGSQLKRSDCSAASDSHCSGPTFTDEYRFSNCSDRTASKTVDAISS